MSHDPNSPDLAPAPAPRRRKVARVCLVAAVLLLVLSFTSDFPRWLDLATPLLVIAFAAWAGYYEIRYPRSPR